MTSCCFQKSQTTPLALAPAPFGTEMATPTALPRLLQKRSRCYSFSEERKIERFSEDLQRHLYFSRNTSTSGIGGAPSCSMLMTRRPGGPVTKIIKALRLAIMFHQNGFYSERPTVFQALQALRPQISSSETQMASRQQRLTAVNTILT